MLVLLKVVKSRFLSMNDKNQATGKLSRLAKDGKALGEKVGRTSLLRPELVHDHVPVGLAGAQHAGLPAFFTLMVRTVGKDLRLEAEA